MAIPANVVKNVISGTFDGGERWQTAWWDTSSTPPDVDDTSTGLFAATSQFNALMVALLPIWAAGTRATAFDQYGYTGGSAATSHGHAALTRAGSAPSIVHPYQCAMVVTLRTGQPGRSFRGRMYLPATGIAVSPGTGLMDATAVNSVVDAVATFFTALTGGGAAVVSQTLSAAHLVTSVDADYIMDTQRRRTNKLVSSRHSAAV